MNAKIKRTFLIIIILAAIVGAAYYFLVHNQSSNSGSSSTKNGRQNTAKTPNVRQAASFNKKQYSNDDPTSLWVVVNKQRPLNPKDYAPSDLVAPNVPLREAASSPEMHVRQAAATALESMFKAADADGVHLMLASGYRSYGEQVTVYGSEVSAYGQAVADSESARPGFSEHQTGLAADLEDANRQCEVADCFANLPEGKWVAQNAYKYGFIIRYPADKASITGYRYESWHVRYIGTDLSQEMHREGITTLEEFFGLPAAPDYN